MKLFERNQVAEAKAHAAAGGQGLHVWEAGRSGYPDAPSRSTSGFIASSQLGQPWARLFDQDHARLVATARRLGVWRIVVQRKGEPGQHVDLCGRPLKSAIAEATA